MRSLLLIPFSLIAAAAEPRYDLQWSARGNLRMADTQPIWSRGDKVCSALESVYKTGRVKIEESETGLVFWCNFNPPRLPEQ